MKALEDPALGITLIIALSTAGLILLLAAPLG